MYLKTHDVSGSEGRDPVEDLETINGELEQYSPELAKRPMIVVANKMDKLKKSEIEPNLACIRQTLGLPDTVELIPFSAQNGTGRDALLGFITQDA